MIEQKKYIRDGRAPIPEKEITSRIMSSIKDRNTKPELAIRKAMWDNGIKGYRLYWKKVPGKPDIAFPSKKVAIFVNGCYWHRCPNCNPSTPKSNVEFWNDKFQKNVERDKRKVQQLKQLEWEVLTLWECQIKKNMDICVDEIKSYVYGQ